MFKTVNVQYIRFVILAIALALLASPTFTQVIFAECISSGSSCSG